MTNFRAKDDKGPQIQVNMKDLQLGTPFKNGFIEAEIIDKYLNFEYEGLYFCFKFICKDQNQQYFELYVFNLGCNKEFDFHNSLGLGVGKTIKIFQPYMLVNK